MGEGDSRGSAHQEDAAVVRRSGLREFLERPVDEQTEIDTLAAWADAGARKAIRRTRRAAQMADGWGIPKPDVCSTMPTAFEVPAKAKIDYQYIVVPTGFTEDKWVQMVEARPSARSVVHHVVVYIREPDRSGCEAKRSPAFLLCRPERRRTASRATTSAAAGATF